MEKVQLKKSNAEYLAIWNDLSLKPFLPFEEMLENEVGIYAAHRQEIGIQKDEDEDKRVELLNSLKEWLECQIYSIDKYLGLIEPDAIAVWKAALNAPNAKEAFGEEAYNDLKLQKAS
jgi:hypothetical protein